MDRRVFIQHSALLAVGISAFGRIGFSHGKYVGDSPTTTDILGPFYRPGAPLRENINPSGYQGRLLHFFGTIFRDDGATPYKGSSVEIWQCDANGKYDNTSDEFRYRGRQIADTEGKYHFITAVPVPYLAAADVWRPAHIHMVVTGEGQQDLITQIYFTGDPYLETDSASASPVAKSRILNVGKRSDGQDDLRFDVVMQKEFGLDQSAVRRISGIYAMSDKSLMEFYQVGDLLFLKWNGQIREALIYKGRNEFVSGGNARTSANFQLDENGDVRVKVKYFRLADKTDIPLEGLKTLSY